MLASNMSYKEIPSKNTLFWQNLRGTPPLIEDSILKNKTYIRFLTEHFISDTPSIFLALSIISQEWTTPYEFCSCFFF